jgi:hypothetical protein
VWRSPSVLPSPRCAPAGSDPRGLPGGDTHLVRATTRGGGSGDGQRNDEVMPGSLRDPTARETRACGDQLAPPGGGSASRAQGRGVDGAGRGVDGAGRGADGRRGRARASSAAPRVASPGLAGPKAAPAARSARTVCLQSEPEPLAEAITAAATGEPGSDREAGGGRRPARRRPPWPRRAELGAAAAVALTAALLRRRQALRAPEAEGSRGRHSLVTVAAAHGEAPPPPPLLTRRPAAASALPSGGGGRASLHAPAARAPGPTAAGVGGHRRWGTLPRAACRPAPSSGGMPTRGWSPIGLTPT